MKKKRVNVRLNIQTREKLGISFARLKKAIPTTISSLYFTTFGTPLLELVATVRQHSTNTIKNENSFCHVFGNLVDASRFGTSTEFKNIPIGCPLLSRARPLFIHECVCRVYTRRCVSSCDTGSCRNSVAGVNSLPARPCLRPLAGSPLGWTLKSIPLAARPPSLPYLSLFFLRLPAPPASGRRFL